MILFYFPVISGEEHICWHRFECNHRYALMPIFSSTSFSISGIMNFSKLEPIGESPSPRTWHSTTVLSDQRSFCIYGGYNGTKALSDVFVFNSGIFLHFFAFFNQ